MWLWIIAALGGVLFALALFRQAARSRSKGAQLSADDLRIAAAAASAAQDIVAAATAPATIRPEPLPPPPDELGGLLHDIDAAADRGDFAEAARRAQLVRVKYPMEPGGFARGAAALLRGGQQAAAEALIESGIEKLGRLAPLLDCRAHLAYNYGDFALAAERFAELRRLFPDRPDGYVWGAEALTNLGQHAAAEALLTELIDGKLQGTTEFSLMRFGGYARYRQDWQEAARRWRLLLRHHPASADGYLGLSEALRHCSEWAEASQVIAAARSQWPDDERIDREAHLVDAQLLTTDAAGVGLPVTGSAEMHEAAEAHEEALDAVVPAATEDDAPTRTENGPAIHDPLPTQTLEECLLAAREAEPDTALALLRHAVERFPLAAEAHHDLARAAERRADFVTAERAWRGFIAVQPDAWLGHDALANALREQGKPVEADAVLASAIQRLPHESILATSYALLAQADGNLPLAEQRWDDVIARFPDVWRGYVGKAEVLAVTGRTEQADALIELTARRFADDPAARNSVEQWRSR